MNHENRVCVETLTERHDELSGMRDDDDITSAEVEELQELTATLAELCGMGGDHQWNGGWYPGELIAESYFEEYAQELAEDCGMLNDDAEWPNNCIDWERAARELSQDYSLITIGGEDYYTR